MRQPKGMHSTETPHRVARRESGGVWGSGVGRSWRVLISTRDSSGTQGKVTVQTRQGSEGKPRNYRVGHLIIINAFLKKLLIILG